MNNTLKKRGFTLIELLVVMTIISVLLSLTVPRYFQYVQTAQEGVLIQNLHVVREAIDKFSADMGRYPNSLEELVERRYIRELPIDPVLDSTSAWLIIAPPANKAGAVYDIKSTAPGTTKGGKEYSSL